MGGLEKRRKALGVWHRIAEKFFTGRPLGNFSKRGWGRIQNVFGVRCARYEHTEQKPWREDRRGWGNARKHVWNSFHRLRRAGFGVSCPDWRLLPPTYHSSCTGSSLTGTGAFVSALQRSKSTVENPACWKKKNKWLNIARPCAHTWCRTELLPRQTANSSVWVDPHNDSKWPRPTHALPQRGPDENQQGDYHLTRESRDEELKTVNSDTLASQQHPLFLPQLSWAALQKEREKKKSWKIYSLSRSLSRSLSLSLSLVPPLLILTIKQRCKNRMFLAGAQQWQRREGTGPYVKEKKKIPLAPGFSALKTSNVQDVLVLFTWALLPKHV